MQNTFLISNKLYSSKNIFHFFSYLSKSLEKNSLKESIVKYISFYEGDKRKLAIIVLDSLENGGRFFSFFENKISSVVYNMIKSAEISGNLKQGLQNSLMFSSNLNKLKKEVISAIVYPLFLLLSCLMGFVLFEIFIIPTIVDSFSGMGISFSFLFKLLVFISNILISYGFYLVVGLLMTLLAFVYFIKSKHFREVPIIKNVYLFIDTYVLFYSLRVFLESNVVLYDAVSSLSGSFFLKGSQKSLNHMEMELFDGKSFYDAIKSSSFLSFGVKDMIMDGSDDLYVMAKEIEESLFEQLEKVKELIKNYSEPVLLVIVGGVVFLAISAVFAPLSEMVNSLSF